MTMSVDLLKDELLAMDPAETEAKSIEVLSGAYAAYAAGASANGVQITDVGVEAGRTAMAGALVGMSAPGAGLVAIPAAIRAFWAGVAIGLAASFAGAIAITPPPMATLEAVFLSLMSVNTNAGLDKAEATEALATLLYAQAIVGGTVTFPGPLVAPIL